MASNDFNVGSIVKYEENYYCVIGVFPDKSFTIAMILNDGDNGTYLGQEYTMHKKDLKDNFEIISNTKKVFTKIETRGEIVLKEFVELMKKYNTTIAYIYSYNRDNDGDFYEQDYRELYDERDWDDKYLNGHYNVKENGWFNGYNKDIDELWDKIVSLRLWSNKKFNPNCEKYYSEIMMGAGHRDKIVFEINEDGTYGFRDEWGYY